MGKDKSFKECVSFSGFIKKASSKLHEYYQPDVVFEQNKITIICESSTTGDRKVHIGELVQFLTYVSENRCSEKKFYFVLFISNTSNGGPKPSIEAKKLKYYFDRFALPKYILDTIGGVFVVDQELIDIENMSITLLTRSPFYSII